MDESIECQKCGGSAVWTGDDEYKCECGWFSMKLSTADPAIEPCFYAGCLECHQVNGYFPMWTLGKLTHCGACGADLYVNENGQEFWDKTGRPDLS
jgi:hypothetical protein